MTPHSIRRLTLPLDGNPRPSRPGRRIRAAARYLQSLNGKKRNKTRRKSMENPWKIYGKMEIHGKKIHGKSMQNPWKIHGRSTEIHGKYMQNPLNIHGKSMQNTWKINGRSIENNSGKSMENPWSKIHGKSMKSPWKIHRKSMESNEKTLFSGSWNELSGVRGSDLIFPTGNDFQPRHH